MWIKFFWTNIRWSNKSFADSISQTNESYAKESLTNDSFALIPGEDEVEVVVAAAREVADPKGFLSMKAITKLLLPEEKEER